jgi:hypothetical protein
MASMSVVAIHQGAYILGIKCITQHRGLCHIGKEDGHEPALFRYTCRLRRGRDHVHGRRRMGRMGFMAVSDLILQQPEFPSALAKKRAEFLPEVRTGERNTALPSTHIESGSSYLISYL